MILRSLAAFLLLALTASRGPGGEPPPEDPTIAPITTALAQVRGWGPLSLGQSVDEVRATLARLELPIVEEGSAPASELLTLTFASEGDVVNAVFERRALIVVSLQRTYVRDPDARRRVAALEQAWGRGSRREDEGRNLGHVATHHEWRTSAVVVHVTVRIPGIGQPTEYTEDYRAP